MSKKAKTIENEALQDVKTEVPQKSRRESHDNRRRSKSSARSSEFVYVNNAYVGSMNSVNENRIAEAPTSVIREQYWTCSKWPMAQRILAIAVGVLLGAVIGLAVTMIIRAAAPDIGGILKASAPD